MILFPNAKINLGLDILRRRHDGYHDIATVIVAVDWCDILEIVPAAGDAPTLTVSGRAVDCPPEKNLVMKAYRALGEHIGRQLPPVDIYLHKIIPDGAGLGGGSADAAFALNGFNEVLSLGLDKRELAAVAARVGADCPFFVYNTPALCTGTGTSLTHIGLPMLKSMHIAIAKPKVAAVSTAQAYAGVKPSPDAEPIPDILEAPVATWQGRLKNDFETSIFPLLPAVEAVKADMIAGGAVYAAMSGSGASVLGLFDDAKLAQQTLDALPHCDTHLCRAVL